MKTHLASLAFSIVLIITPALPAAEPPELERQFLQGLRSRGYSRLALEYLQRLEKSAPPELAVIVPLEIARTQLSLAEESPLDERPALYDQALAKLKKFEADHPARPEVVEAKMEIARIVSLQGKVHLSRAVRHLGDSTERGKEAKAARDHFEEARSKLADAIKLLDGQAAKYKDSKSKTDQAILEVLERDKLQAEFDLGLNVLFQAETFFLSAADDAARKRGELAREALDRLRDVAKRDDKNSLCFKARAWLIACALTGDQPKDALQYYKQIDTLKPDEHNLDGKLLADYFHFGLIPWDDKLKKNILVQIRKEAQDWLKGKGHAAFGSSPGGYGIRIRLNDTDSCFVSATAADVKKAVRLELAEVCVAEADALKTKQSKSPRVKELFQEAEKLLAPLQDTENELTRKAQDLNLQIFIALRGKSNDINQLTRFRDLYFQSRYEAHEYFQAKDPAERKRHLQNIALALERALDMADARVPPKDVLRAGYELIDAYLNLGDLHRAVVLGEHLARTNPPSSETARAAAFALEAYVKILRADQALKEHRGEGVLTDDVIQEIQRSDLERFRRLSNFIETQKAWTDQPVGQYARYQRALFALRGNHYDEAIPLLRRITKSWDGYSVARCQLALALIRLTEDEPPIAVTESDRKKYLQEAAAVLQSLPPITGQDSPLLLHFHFAAKLKQCKLLYKDKKYQELEAFAGKLLDQFDEVLKQMEDRKVEVEDDVKTNVRLGLETWKNYAKVGMAEQAYGEGKYAEVLALTGPVVARVQKQVQDKEVIKDFLAVRDMLELNLRASVQQNKRAEARAVLALLQQIANDPELTGGTGIKPTEILVRLVFQLRAQVQDLRAKGKAAEAELKQTIANFTEFMDELAKDLPRNARKAAQENQLLQGEIDRLKVQLAAATKDAEKQALTDQLTKLAERRDAAAGQERLYRQQIPGLLARSYASLDQHKKAAALLAGIPEPKGHNGRPPGADEVKDFLDVQLLYVQELRHDKQYKQAEAVLDALAKKQTGQKSLTMTILNLETEKEKVHLLEDQGKYSAAVTAWNALTKTGSALRRLLADRNFESMLARYKQEADRNRMAPVLQKMYKDLERTFFDCWYHKAYSMYQYGKQTKKPQWVTAAAKVIVSLENGTKGRDEDEPLGWKYTKAQFLALLAAEPDLKKAYDKVKSGTP
jgi:hypothetical protein